MLSHIVPHNRSSNYSKLSILSQSVYIIPYDPTLSDMIIAHYPIWSHISPYYLIFIHVIVHKKLSTNLQHILPEKKKKPGQDMLIQKFLAGIANMAAFSREVHAKNHEKPCDSRAGGALLVNDDGMRMIMG